MQFQAQAGVQGKKTSGGAKLTAKRDKNNEHFQTYFIFAI